MQLVELKKVLKRVSVFLLFVLISFCGYTQVQPQDSSAVPSVKYTQYRFTINPIRAFVDEINVNWDLIDENGNGQGFSFGYIYPNTLVKDILNTFEGSQDLEIRANSYGAAVRYFRIIATEKSFIQPTFQLKYYHTDKDGYTWVVNNKLSSSAKEVSIDRHTLVYGLQLKYGRDYRIADFMIFRLYSGIGFNVFHNISTTYNNYTYHNNTQPVPDEYKLNSDQGVKANLSVHLGMRIGFAVKR